MSLAIELFLVLGVLAPFLYGMYCYRLILQQGHLGQNEGVYRGRGGFFSVRFVGPRFFYHYLENDQEGELPSVRLAKRNLRRILKYQMLLVIIGVSFMLLAMAIIGIASIFKKSPA